MPETLKWIALIFQIIDFWKLIPVCCVNFSWARSQFKGARLSVRQETETSLGPRRSCQQTKRPEYQCAPEVNCAERTISLMVPLPLTNNHTAVTNARIIKSLAANISSGQLAGNSFWRLRRCHKYLSGDPYGTTVSNCALATDSIL